MSLDRIQSAKPEFREPVPAKEFPDLYIVEFGLGFHGPGVQPVSVTFRNYNYDTKEFSDSPDADTRFAIPNLWEEVARSTMVAQVAGGLTVLLKLLYQENALRRKLEGLDYEGRDRDIETLWAVQDALGAERDKVPPPFVETTTWAKPMEEPEPEPVVEPESEPTSQEIWDSLSFTEIV
jgi:hypothetical protein